MVFDGAIIGTVASSINAEGSREKWVTLEWREFPQLNEYRVGMLKSLRPLGLFYFPEITHPRVHVRTSKGLSGKKRNL